MHEGVMRHVEVAEVTTRSKASRQPQTHLGNNKHKCLLGDAMLSLADVQAQVRIFTSKYSVAQVVLGVGGGSPSQGIWPPLSDCFRGCNGKLASHSQE